MLLNNIIPPRYQFDINNDQHVAKYAKFLKTGSWGKNGCPFILEHPYDSIPEMINVKLVYRTLNIKNTDIFKRGGEWLRR